MKLFQCLRFVDRFTNKTDCTWQHLGDEQYWLHLENENCVECDLLPGVVKTIMSSVGRLHRVVFLTHATTDALYSVLATSPSALQAVGSHKL